MTVGIGCVAEHVDGKGIMQAVVRVTCSDRSGLLAGEAARAVSCRNCMKGHCSLFSPRSRPSFAPPLASDLTGHLMYNCFDIMSANVTTDTETGATHTFIFLCRALRAPTARSRRWMEAVHRPFRFGMLTHLIHSCCHQALLSTRSTCARQPNCTLSPDVHATLWHRCPGLGTRRAAGTPRQEDPSARPLRRHSRGCLRALALSTSIAPDARMVATTLQIRYAEAKPLTNSVLRNLELSMMSVAEGGRRGFSRQAGSHTLCPFCA